jgi:integrase
VTVYRARDRHTRGAAGERLKAFRYDFRYLGRRYVSPRSWPTEREARDAEAERRRQLRRAAAGLEVPETQQSPYIADWAEVYLAFRRDRGRDRDMRSLTTVLRVVLRFWGRQPDRPLGPHERGPYHDLRLNDPVTNPQHLLAFETWMAKRGSGGSTRNHYRTAMSQLYRIAMLPQYRSVTLVTMNPFAGLMRDSLKRRTATLTLPQIRDMLQAAAPHLRLAIAIGSLAPKLRLDNVLGLRWTDIDLERGTITVAKHKTAHITDAPLVAMISDQLRAILEAARAERDPDMPYLVHYHGRRLVKLDSSLKHACAAAGVRYGRNGGVTFHSIRHTAATMLAALGVADRLRQEALGHLSGASTQWYTHLQPVHELPAIERLSEALPILDLVVGTPVGHGAPIAAVARPRTINAEAENG